MTVSPLNFLKNVIFLYNQQEQKYKTLVKK